MKQDEYTIMSGWTTVETPEGPMEAFTATARAGRGQIVVARAQHLINLDSHDFIAKYGEDAKKAIEESVIQGCHGIAFHYPSLKNP